MRSIFTIAVEFDAGYVEQTAQLRGVAVETVVRELIGRLEYELHDTAKWRQGHGVLSVGVRSELHMPERQPA